MPTETLTVSVGVRKHRDADPPVHTAKAVVATVPAPPGQPPNPSYSREFTADAADENKALRALARRLALEVGRLDLAP